MNAQYIISKTGRNFTVTLNDEVVATKKSKAQAQAWVDSQFTAQTNQVEATPAEQATEAQEQPMTETTNEAQTEEQAPEGEQAEQAEQTTEGEAQTEGEQAAPEEQDPVKVARSQKLRDAMNAVLEKVRAGDYKPEESHPSLLATRKLHVTFQGDDERTDDLPAVLFSRKIDSFSDKSRVEGVTFMGKDVPAARTKGTWAGITRSFLWFEAPVLDFPASMVGATKKAVVTFHILIDNDQYDNLEGAAIEASDDPVAAPTADQANAAEQEAEGKAMDAHAAKAAAKEAGVKPAKRKQKQAEQAAE